MKNRVLFISISIFILLAVILTINSAPKEKIYLNKDNIEANKSLAIYIEQENGSYNKTTTFPSKEDGYTLNTSKSVCNGSTNISWDKESWGIELSNIDREETKCYLYFDIYVPTAGETIIAGINKDYIKEGNPDFTKVATGAEPVTDNGIYKTVDPMYDGESYYWRGAATTNHVIFADKCWRIVRINGDGSIRLIYNGTPSGTAPNQTCTGNGSNAGSIAMTSQKYNANVNRSEYVGYTYTEGSQRTENNAVGTASNLKTQTEGWFDNNITGDNLKKVDLGGKYCNDRNTVAGYTWNSQPTSTFYYAGYDRSGAKSATSVTPTLECDSSDVYTLKAGTIMMDEVIMAGGKWGTINSSYYLYNGQYYWTMSPCYWNSSSRYAGMFYVNANGNFDNDSVGSAIGIRPVINLKPDTIFTEGGDGTLNNPYVVS